MKIDRGLIGATSADCGPLARDAEARGFDGVWASETVTDSFLQAQAALIATSTVSVGTAATVAFARNPMSVAYQAWDLAGSSGGRFLLGLGTQVGAHIERRFSMPWSAPVARMREFLAALDAIFATWRDGGPLRFEGEVYRHDLMSPVFTPPHHDRPIRRMLAGVGVRMTELAGETCDGLLLHAMTHPRYIDDVMAPALARGLAIAGRRRADFELYGPVFMVMGDTDEEIAEMTRRTREQFAFYASTPAYAQVLAAVGYEGVQPELQRLSRAGRWTEMADVVDDGLLAEFSLTGTPEEMPALCRERFGGRLDRVSSYFGWSVSDPDRLEEILGGFGRSDP